MKKIILGITILTSITAFSSETVTSSSFESSDYFNVFSSSVNVLKAHRQDAFDRAMKTGTRDLKSYCENRGLSLDEKTISITLQTTELDGPAGSLRASFDTHLDLVAECK